MTTLTSIESDAKSSPPVALSNLPSLPTTPPDAVLKETSIGPSTRATSTRAHSPTRSFREVNHGNGTLEQYELTARLESLYAQQDGDRSFALPPVQGKQAWLFVAAAVVVETLIWGASNAFGVFQRYYTSHPPFNTSSPIAISLIGTLCLACQYSSGFVYVPIFQKYPHLVWKLCFMGIVVYSTLLIIAGFANQVWQMIIIFVFVGLAAGLSYLPIILWLPEWFSTKKGLASGLVFAGTGIGGLLFPPIAELGLENWGYEWTLRAWGVISLLIGMSAIWFVRPRVPLPSAAMVRNRSGRPLLLNLGFKTNPAFLHTVFAIFAQSLGIGCALLFIPSYAVTVGLTNREGTIALALYNLAGVIGQITIGFVSDRIYFLAVFAAVGLLQSLAAFLLWGFATNFAILVSFSLAFGWVGGGSTSPWTVTAVNIAGNAKDQIGPMFSVFAFAKGIASVIGPVIGGILYHPPAPTADQSAMISKLDGIWGVQGSKNLIIFVGTVVLLGGVIAISGYRGQKLGAVY